MGVNQQQVTKTQPAKQGNTVSGQVPRTKKSTGRVTALDRWLLRKMHDFVGNPPVVVSLWNGVEFEPEGESVGHFKFNDRMALYLLLSDPELHFGDLYSSGRIEIDADLVSFLESVYPSIARNYEKSLIRTIMKAWIHRPRLNSLSGSRDNIYHHYDISNSFYEMWLDKEAMQYTCAYFPDPDMTLEQAQVAKLHHVCRKLQLKPGDTVVEAGCGWGGLARFMAKHYDVNVKAYNISHQQLVFARSRALQEGLADKVEYIEEDYRNIQGEFDVFVSVGMLEHVGSQHYKTLGKVIERCLKPEGRGLVHSIGRNQPGLMNAWVERRIFPGAYPPSLREMMDIFEPYNFAVQDVENLRLHYARTLEHWLQRYNDNEEKIAASFDDSFVRAWRLYLAGSIAAFTTGELQLFQIMFTRAENNMLPWSRAHLHTQLD